MSFPRSQTLAVLLGALFFLTSCRHLDTSARSSGGKEMCVEFKKRPGKKQEQPASLKEWIENRRQSGPSLAAGASQETDSPPTTASRPRAAKPPRSTGARVSETLLATDLLRESENPEGPPDMESSPPGESLASADSAAPTRVAKQQKVQKSLMGEPTSQKKTIPPPPLKKEIEPRNIAPAGPILIEADNISEIVQTDGRDVEIKGNNGVIIISGGCELLTLSGKNNQIQCDFANEIKISGDLNTLVVGVLGSGMVSGNQNVISWGAAHPSPPPKVTLEGRDNQIARLE